LTVRVYLDSAPLIYVIEGVAPFASTVMTTLAQPETIQLCSELTRLECRVKPVRDGQAVLLAAFDHYFARVIDTVLPITRPVVDQATELRARYGFKTPDALHLAAAIAAGCDVFLTNDQRLARCAEIRIETV